jgi:hypothetical protein
LEIPNPTARGSVTAVFTFRDHDSISGGSVSLAPVTPVTEMRYRNPDPARSKARIRSIPLVGAARGIHASPSERIPETAPRASSYGRSTMRKPSAPAARASRQSRSCPYRKNGL